MLTHHIISISHVHIHSAFELIMTVTKYEFGYWPTMGLGQGARYILNYQKSQNPDLDFKIETYQFSEYNSWLEDKVKQQELTSFPNLPYLKIQKTKNNYLGISTGEDVNNSTVLITQSDAILRAMGMEFGLAGDSVEEQIKIDTVSGVLSDFFKGVLDHLFNFEKWREIADFHENQILNGACKQLDQHFGANKFVGGAKLSWCDFKMLHYREVTDILILSIGSKLVSWGGN